MPAEGYSGGVPHGRQRADARQTTARGRPADRHFENETAHRARTRDRSRRCAQGGGREARRSGGGGSGSARRAGSHQEGQEGSGRRRRRRGSRSQGRENRETREVGEEREKVTIWIATSYVCATSHQSRVTSRVWSAYFRASPGAVTRYAAHCRTWESRSGVSVDAAQPGIHGRG